LRQGGVIFHMTPRDAAAWTRIEEMLFRLDVSAPFRRRAGGFRLPFFVLTFARKTAQPSKNYVAGGQR
jgi:hypothetical protein